VREENEMPIVSNAKLRGGWGLMEVMEGYVIDKEQEQNKNNHPQKPVSA